MIRDHEAAFPLSGGGSGEQTGMTLRDYFAAKAMQAMMSNDTGMMTIKSLAAESGKDGPAQMATVAYGMADAMLLHRAKR